MQQSNYEKINSFFYENGKTDFDRYKYIVVISEEGKCINCNNIFAQAMSDNIHDRDVLFIMSGRGTKVDISAYANNEEENIILDYSAEFKKLKIVHQCAILKISEGRISKQIEIDINNVMDYSTPHSINQGNLDPLD